MMEKLLPLSGILDVLILILVEVGFGGILDSAHRIVKFDGLNPYSSGGGVR